MEVTSNPTNFESSIETYKDQVMYVTAVFVSSVKFCVKTDISKLALLLYRESTKPMIHIHMYLLNLAISREVTAYIHPCVLPV